MYTGLKFTSVSLLVLGFALSIQAQTYQMGTDAGAKPQTKPEPGKPAPQQQLGFGSNIQEARVARAAELALQRGDKAQALEYSRQAVKAAPNDAHLWFLLGYASRLNGRTGESVDAYNHGLRLMPGSLDGLSGLAQTYSMQGRNEEAQKLLKQVIAEDPRRAGDALLLGELQMRTGDYAGAVTWLLKGEQAQPGTRGEVLLAVSYQHLKQLDLANRYLEMAKHRDPNNPDVERTLAGYYLDTGNYPEAIKQLQSIKNQRPDVKAELAYVYQLSGNGVEAAKLYAQAANAMPKDLGLQLSAAQSHVAIGSIEQANAFLKRAQGISAEDYRLHSIRGQIARIQARDADAVEEYTKALANLPPAPPEGPLYGIQIHMDLYQLNQTLKNTGAAQEQLATAKKQIEALDEKGPARTQFLRLRALIKMSGGDLNGAGSDLKEALAINDRDPNTLQMEGDLLMKQGKTNDALAAYARILVVSPNNQFALTSLGYASRAAGRDQDAEKYFKRLAELYPTLYVPYLALGDLYTSRRDFAKAEASYVKAYGLNTKNALIIAGGMNAAIESQKLSQAGVWLARATDDMQTEPQLLRETERYYTFKSEYQKSADVAQKVLPMLPKDRDVVVYLGYDYLNLNRYDELLKLTAQYDQTFPQEPDIPLLAGYAHKHNGQLDEARKDFTEALERDPNVVTAYVNRGYVLHDLKLPQDASTDFEAALKREPNNGEAHLGLAYADLDLHKSLGALKQSQLAEQTMGDSKPLHLIRATAYGQRHVLAKAAAEWRAALKFTPDDPALHFALGGTLYSQRKYHESIDELMIAQKLNPDDAPTYALMARSYAQLNQRDETLKYVQLAEEKAQQKLAAAPGSAKEQKDLSGIYVSTGEALGLLGDQSAAMDHYRKALTTPGSDRVGVRLDIARLMAKQDHEEDASRQVALAMMEAETGETLPPTGEQYIDAADVFRELHEYDLSQDYLQRALTAGAPESSVRIGMANNYLAIGDTTRASGELSRVNSMSTEEPDYQLMLANANLLRQQHQGDQALTAFAQATEAAGEDQTAEQSLLATGGSEGLKINSRLNLLSDFSVDPIFEDTTVYVLDSKLDAPFAVPANDTSLLPPPRSSLETQWTTAYHLHYGLLPTAGGFFQVRNTRGLISVPSTNAIQNRNTNDYNFNFGFNPTVHFGNNSITFNPGIQATIRRDANNARDLNQNLLREFVYVNTSSFFNAISMSGYALHESGPFTEIDLHSRALSAAVDFRVGAPWGRTALVTGWGANDQLFNPVNTENYYTSSYVGVERLFGERVRVRAVAEDLRAWRVFDGHSGIAQAVRPAGTVDFAPAKNWNVRAAAAYSRTQGFHVYDAIQGGISASYAVPYHRGFKDESGEVALQYPIRFSAGLQQETFFNFTGGNNQQFRPYVSISLF